MTVSKRDTPWTPWLALPLAALMLAAGLALGFIARGEAPTCHCPPVCEMAR